MNTPAKLLRAKMKDRSLRSLAREMGVSATYLSHVVNGKRTPGPKILGYLKMSRETVTRYRITGG